jgi:hypothetical protein
MARTLQYAMTSTESGARAWEYAAAAISGEWRVCRTEQADLSLRLVNGAFGNIRRNGPSYREVAQMGLRDSVGRV